MVVRLRFARNLRKELKNRREFEAETDRVEYYEREVRRLSWRYISGTPRKNITIFAIFICLKVVKFE